MNDFDKSFEYPSVDDPELQYKLYKKKEFYSYKIPERINIDDDENIKKLRESQCTMHIPHKYQSFVANFINPNTPYKGVLLFHGLGSGKCITHDQLIYINGNLKQISKIWDDYKTEIITDNDNGEWSTPSVELTVNSLKNETIVECNVNKLYREKIKSCIKKIELENGQSISLTLSHKLFTKDGWTNNINIDDYIAVPRIIYNTKHINILNSDLAYILGFHICSGTEEKYCIKINDSCENTLVLLKNNMESFCIKNNYTIEDLHIEKHDDFDFSIKFKSTDFVEFLKTNNYKFGEQIQNRHIPDFVLKAPLQEIKIFLRGLFDKNGDIYIVHDVKLSYIKLNITNKYVFDQICILCRLFGINMIEHGIIQATDIINFKENIGFYDENKNLLLKKLALFIEAKSICNDILWFKVKKITFIEYDNYVYDMEINETHNFVSNSIICHNTCSAINIAENFKPLVKKYNTKIHIIVPGPLLKESWKKEIIKCTRETYLKYQDSTIFLSEEDREKLHKEAIENALQYYKFLTYRSFYKKVLGDRIIEKREIVDNKVKTIYKKTETGEYARDDLVIDKLTSLSNTLIIVDEAHHFANNTYGDALTALINNKESVNLKIVLLSATPMKNLADEIIDIVNFIRPVDNPLEKDKLFYAQDSTLLKLKPNGLEYFAKMISGYISYVKGADPLIYAKRIDKGVVPSGLLFTKLIKCAMHPFQKETYKNTIDLTDTLDRKSSAVANFVFPILKDDKNTLIGTSGKEGFNILRNQLKIYHSKLNKQIAKQLFNDKEDNYIDLTEDGKGIKGAILKYDNLKYFSVKFNEVIGNLNQLFEGKKGASTAFVYSNLVKIGVNLLQYILLENGYIEYNEDYNSYHFNNNTICYLCGNKYENHKDNHKFLPATFLIITGKLGEEEDVVHDRKKYFIDNVFNNITNIQGKFIKLLLGSRVMSEGINLKNVKEVHIVDVHYNLGNIDQAIGRAIRYCSHYALMNEKNMYPEVEVYKYVIGIEDELTSEEILYQKAEAKHILIKKLERVMKENAIDCPLNMSANVFKEDIEEYKNCKEPNIDENKNSLICPAKCDYLQCNYTCANLKLNRDYYDPTRNIYKLIELNKLDYSTYNYKLSNNEVEFVKTKIKEMFIINYIYTIHDILNYTKSSFAMYKQDMFDKFFVYKALDDLLPVTENDFNNLKDTVIDKYNRSGYLIYRNKFYIFQPFDKQETLPVFYRKKYLITIPNSISLYTYLKNITNNKVEKELETITNKNKYEYNFDDTREYYDTNRNDYKYVGIIDKIPTENGEDIFKIRQARAKILEKKRATGIFTFKGAVCKTAKDRKYLEKIARELDIKIDKNIVRIKICDIIKSKLLLWEKYQTGNTKITYIIIPLNHPFYPFPYNLEDRTHYIINEIKKSLKINFSHSITTIKKTSGEEKGYPSFIIKINLDKSYVDKIDPKYKAYFSDKHINIIVE